MLNQYKCIIIFFNTDIEFDSHRHHVDQHFEEVEHPDLSCPLTSRKKLELCMCVCVWTFGHCVWPLLGVSVWPFICVISVAGRRRERQREQARGSGEGGVVRGTVHYYNYYSADVNANLAISTCAWTCLPHSQNVSAGPWSKSVLSSVC